MKHLMYLPLALGLGLTLLVVWLLSGGVPAANAAALDVCPTCTYTTIQSAVNAAASGDVINIAAGTFAENVNIPGKVLTFLGAGAASTLVDGGGTGRVFSSTSDITLADLTIQNGNVAGDGGGLDTSGALTLTNVNVLSNTATGQGGGVYAEGAMTVSGGLFRNNVSGSDGGGLYANSTLSLTGAQFLGNRASAGGGALHRGGGGAYANRAATLSGGLFQNNVSGWDGGGLYAYSTLSLTGTQFISNTAAGDGGGAIATGAVTLYSGLFQNNQSTGGEGGGLLAINTLTLTGTQFIGNAAARGGGGVYAGGAAKLSGGTFQNNVCGGVGGGLYTYSTLNLTGTQFLGNTAALHGGGAYVDGAATLSGGLFQNNACTGISCTGGGLKTWSSLSLTGTQFLSNTATGDGGGVYAIGAAKLTGGLFQTNLSGGNGGGLYTTNVLSLTGTQFLGNTTIDAGGGAYAVGAATLSGSVFQNNACTGVGCYGGGLHAASAFTLTGAHFLGNTAAGNGGGVRHAGGNGRLVNVLFAGNAGGGNGSALYLNSSGIVELLHTTIASSTAGVGAAIHVNDGTVNITDTLVASYTVGLEQTGGAVNSDYNVFYDAPSSVDIGSHSLTGTNPLFANPAGGNYRLLVGSPATGAGIDVGVATDLDGVTRGDPPTIGAYEAALPPVCFATLDGVTVYSSTNASAVQRAADAAAAGGTVKVAGTCAGVQSRAGADQTVYISRTLTLAGGYTTTNWTTAYPAAQPTTLDAQSGGRVVNATVNLSVSNLTIQNGASLASGGGLAATGMVTLTNVNVLSNTAAGDGGGAYALGAVKLSGGLFQNNACTDSSCYGGGLLAYGTLDLTRTQFLGNTAAGSGGGAYAVDAATLSGGLFQDNTCAGSDCYGGGLLVYSTLGVTDTRFLHNTAAEGGGAYAAGATVLSGGLFQDNTCTGSNCYGGGLLVYGTLGVTGTQFLRNTATGEGGGAYALDAATLSGGLFQNNACTGSNCYGGGLSVYGALRLSGTQFLTNTATGPGGGAYALGAATLSGGLFQNNVSGSYGGGLYAGSTLSLTGTHLVRNTAGLGGGAYAVGAAALSGGLFQNNACTDSSCYGGGLYAGSTLALTGTQFLGNTATYRGGGAHVFGAATLSGGLFQNNVCIGSRCYGGGLYARNTLMLTGTQFLGNTATGAGGGVRHEGGQGRLVNVLFARNAAGGNGAAIYFDSSDTVELLHATIASPTVGGGTAIYVNDGRVHITDTLVANYAVGIRQAGGAASSDYNLFYNAPTTLTIGSHSLTGTNPLFVNPAGGNYRLQVGSPAAGKGLAVGVATDLDGNPRHARPTIGAYELASFLITPSAGAGGSLTPGTPQTVAYGGRATFTITANSGYQISDVRVDGVSVGVTTTYTFDNVTANHTLAATFALNPLASLALSAQPKSLYANGLDVAALTITATDAGGRGAPFAGRVVTLTLGARLGALSSPTVTLGANGVATATYVAGVTAGGETITASAFDRGSFKTATATINVLPNPLTGRLTARLWDEVIAYTFVVTNAGSISQTVVMSGSLPANTVLVTVTGGVWAPTGGDYGRGYVKADNLPLQPGQSYTLLWSVRPSAVTSDIVTQAHASSAQARLRLTVTGFIRRVWFPLMLRNWLQAAPKLPCIECGP